MDILLLRHGQTDENRLGILQGHSDTRLNALGRQQARALAGRIRDWVPRVQALVMSDLTRAGETAAPVAEALGLTPSADAAWRERGFGSFEGQTLGEAEIWRAATGTGELPGAEPVADFQARVRDALVRLTRTHAPFACVAVVTHGGPMRTLLQLFRDGRLALDDVGSLPPPAPIENCSILHLQVLAQDGAGPAFRVAAVNEVAHLADGLLPG